MLNEFGEKNNLKVDDQELKNAIQKQVQSMPGQEKQILEYYQKNPSATASLRGSLYEEKIINLKKIAYKRNQTISQMALSWILRHQEVTSALIGARTIKQLDECLDSLNNLNFTKKELKSIGLT